jgi:hypothetical protein
MLASGRRLWSRGRNEAVQPAAYRRAAGEIDRFRDNASEESNNHPVDDRYWPIE